MFNVASRQGKAQYQGEMLRIMARLEQPFARGLAPLLKKQFNAAADLVEQGLTAVDRAVDKMLFPLNSFFVDRYTRVAVVFGDEALKRWAESEGKKADSMRTRYWQSINGWARREAATKVVKINRATRNNIATVLSNGMKDGKSNADIAKEIRSVGGITSRVRAARIARTETHTASVNAVNEATKSTGMEFEREWVAAIDDRTRGAGAKDQFSHIKANGEKVGMEQPFLATGEALMFPGDPKGSPGNVVNCRCVLLYHRKAVGAIDAPAGRPSRQRRVPEEIAPETKPEEKPESVPIISFRTVGKVSEEHIKEIQEGMDKIPLGVKKVLSDYGLQPVTADFASTFDPGLKGLTPRGWPKGHTWDNTEGFFREGSKTMVVTEKNINPWSHKEEAVSHFRKIYVLRHETGHALDAALKNPSSSVEFMKAYNLDVAEIRKAGKGAKHSYYLQSGSAGSEETFAEMSFGVFSKKAKETVFNIHIDAFPNTYKYVEKLVEGLEPVAKIARVVEEPMAAIGKLASCVVSRNKSFFNIFVETKERPASCNDFVRAGGKWFLRGQEVSDAAELARLEGLHLPPAWLQVTVSADRGAKIQAVGLDAAGRWQYRYSAEHVEGTSIKKFNRVKLFSKDIPAIRSSVVHGMAEGDARAFLLELEDKTAIRAGSMTDFKAKKKAYGLTTLKNEHVAVSGNRVVLDFVAKEGIPAHYELEHPALAAWLSERKATTSAGDFLFPDVPASKLNAYIKVLAGGRDYTIKDFRTYHGTRVAYEELKRISAGVTSAMEKKKAVKQVSEKVSAFLRNTPLMARKAYIDPMVWDVIGGL